MILKGAGKRSLENPRRRTEVRDRIGVSADVLRYSPVVFLSDLPQLCVVSERPPRDHLPSQSNCVRYTYLARSASECATLCPDHKPQASAIRAARWDRLRYLRVDAPGNLLPSTSRDTNRQRLETRHQILKNRMERVCRHKQVLAIREVPWAGCRQVCSLDLRARPDSRYRSLYTFTHQRYSKVPSPFVRLGEIRCGQSDVPSVECARSRERTDRPDL